MRNSIIKFVCGSVCSCFVLSNVAVGMNKTDGMNETALIDSESARILSTIDPNSVHPNDLRSELLHRKFLELHPERVRHDPNNGPLRTAESSVDKSSLSSVRDSVSKFNAECNIQ